MSQKTYMYDTQWTALINAINGGDTSAIATALGQIKTSIDSITTALGSLSTDVIQDSTQWTNLINAISSGGGGGGGTIDIDATQWSNLLTEIGKGDMSATATALNNIYTRLNSIGFNSTQWTNLINAISSGGGGGTIDIDATQWSNLLTVIGKGDMSATATALNNIYTRLNSIGFNSTQWTNLINAISSGGGGGTIDIDATQWGNLLSEIGKGDMTATATALNNIYTRLNTIGFNSTQWSNLVNAITNQSLTVDLSNITSSVVSNLSNVPGSTSTDALNVLNSTLTTISESSVTPVSAYSSLFWFNKLYKKAGIVYVDIEFSDPSNTRPIITTYNTQIKVGTLPNGFKPIHRIYVTFAIMNQNSGAYMGTGQSMIDVNGDVYINIPRQCNFACIQVAYIANS